MCIVEEAANDVPRDVCVKEAGRMVFARYAMASSSIVLETGEAQWQMMPLQLEPCWHIDSRVSPHFGVLSGPSAGVLTAEYVRTEIVNEAALVIFKVSENFNSSRL